VGWGDWVRVTNVGGDIGLGVIIENGFNLYNKGLEAVKGCKCPFFKTILVNPINLSQKPPNQGARLGINFHSTPDLERVFVSESEENKAFSCSAADRKVDALSKRTRCGRDFLQLKRRKACRKHSTERPVMISRCTARVTAQVNKQMYTLHSP